MRRWIVPSIAVVALLTAAVWIAGCTNDAETPPPATTEAPVDATAPTAAAHDVEGQYTYTCPMHPEVNQERPGKCPECGMFLVADTDEDVEYYCPMHENVVEEDPGKCPECGMFLEARSPDDAQ